MLKVLNRNYKQSFDGAVLEFPDCHFLMKLDNMFDTEGYVVAVSEESETHGALCDMRKTYPKGTIFFIGGVYKNVSAIGIQNEID